jgi:hypothetical protein
MIYSRQGAQAVNLAMFPGGAVKMRIDMEKECADAYG